MKKNQYSTTAEGIALLRALETVRPAGIVNDPYARALISPWLWWLAKIFYTPASAERRGKGVVGFLAARDRYIDDFLKTCLAEGMRQVVILGAGFDSRAYRIPGMETVRVFEIDHPATQTVKRQRLQKVLKCMPDNVVFVPVDFNTQSLEDRLRDCGYDRTRQTVFIWQGVVYYITPAAVDTTLQFIANHSAPGSAVVFDYANASYLKDTSRGEIKRMRMMQRFTSEGLSFGIGEGQIEPFLTQRGFTAVKNATADDLKRLYFTGPNAGREITPGYAIAAAVVK
jgi:methyltransferase (TIGR00027 family)